MEEKEKTPDKPSPPKIVNQPPVAAVVDEKHDPRVQKNKKRISLSGKLCNFFVHHTSKFKLKPIAIGKYLKLIIRKRSKPSRKTQRKRKMKK